MYALIETVKQNGHIPFKYLKAVFEKAPFKLTDTSWLSFAHVRVTIFAVNFKSAEYLCMPNAKKAAFSDSLLNYMLRIRSA
jgi:hypothetical protein